MRKNEQAELLGNWTHKTKRGRYKVIRVSSKAKFDRVWHPMITYLDEKGDEFHRTIPDFEAKFERLQGIPRYE